MIAVASILGVCAVALGMVLTPGPNMLYLVSRSITQGRRAGVVSLGGVALGFLFYLTAANLGLSVIFLAGPELYLTVKLAGAAYLGCLAWKALRPGGTSLFEPQPRARTACGSGIRSPAQSSPPSPPGASGGARRPG